MNYKLTNDVRQDNAKLLLLGKEKNLYIGKDFPLYAYIVSIFSQFRGVALMLKAFNR